MSKEVHWQLRLNISHKADFKKLLNRLSESDSYIYEVKPNQSYNDTQTQEVHITSKTTKELFALTHWLNTNINDVIY